MQTSLTLVLLTCLPDSLCGKVSCKLLEDIGHLLLHEKTDEVRRCVELQRQRAGKPTPPLLYGGLEGFAQSFYFVVCTLCKQEEMRVQSEGWVLLFLSTDADLCSLWNITMTLLINKCLLHKEDVNMQNDNIRF